jgi:hypothetical protein
VGDQVSHPYKTKSQSYKLITTTEETQQYYYVTDGDNYCQLQYKYEKIAEDLMN